MKLVSIAGIRLEMEDGTCTYLEWHVGQCFSYVIGLEGVPVIEVFTYQHLTFQRNYCTCKLSD